MLFSLLLIFVNNKFFINYCEVKNMSEIPKAPIARIIKESGAERVSEDAKAELAAYLEEVARDVAKEANQVAKIAKRKTVKAEDIKLAIKNL